MHNFTEHWHWPQFTVLIFLFLGLIIKCTKHGQSQEPYSAFGGFIYFMGVLFLLISGNFFA